MDKIYSKIMWEDIPRIPKYKQREKTTKDSKTLKQEKAMGSNGVSDRSENGKSS